MPSGCRCRIARWIASRSRSVCATAPTRPAVLAEARRVLRPGGRFFCLEFSHVQVAALQPLYDAWSFRVLPRLGPLRRAGRGELSLSGGEHPDVPGPGDAGRRCCGRPGSRAWRCATCRAALRRSIRDGGCDDELMRLPSPAEGARPSPQAAPQGGDLRRQARAADRLGRHRRLQGAGTDPPAARPRLRRHLRADRGGRAVRHAAVAAGTERGQGLHRPVLADRRERDGAHPALAQRRPGGGGAGLGRHPGEDGGGPCGRSRLDAAAGDRQAGAGGAGDERADVAACGDRGEHGAAGRARHPRRRAGRGRDGLQRVRPRPARRTAGDPRGDRGAARRRRGRSPGAMRWSPAGRRTSRSIRCATSPTAPAAGRAMRSPRRSPNWARA